MSETGLTLTEDKTFSELYKEFEEEQKKIMELDYSNLTEGDKALLNDYNEKKNFLKEMAASLDYAQNSGALLAREQDGKQIASLEVITSKEAYVAEILTLTNGLDKNVMAELQRGEDKFAVNELNAQMETVLNEPSMQAELRRQIQERGGSEITVKEIQDIQIQIQNEQREADLRLQEQQREELQKLQEQQEQERQAEELRRQQEQEQNEPSNAERFAKLAETAALVVVATEVMPELTKAVEKAKEEEKKREQDGKEVSVSAEIADDGHAVIKNIEGEGRTDDKGNVDRTEVESKIEQKVSEKVSEVKETVDLHSREVAPKSEQAETERKAEKPHKRNRDVMDR